MAGAQTVYNTAPDAAYAGQLADSSMPDVVSRMAAADTAPGLFVFRGTNPGTARPPAATDAIAASATAILATGGVSTGGQQVLSGAGTLNGAVGVGVMFPPRNVTLVFSNHANWLATTAVVTGVDENGETVSENFAIPAGGNATVTGAVKFKSVTSITIPAQGGGAGTFTAGIGSLLGSVNLFGPGVALYDSTKKPGAYLAASQESMPVLKKGRVWLSSEAAVTEGDPVFIRFQVGTGAVLGAARPSADANTCVRLRGARWAKTTTGAGLAVAEINLPAP